MMLNLHQESDVAVNRSLQHMISTTVCLPLGIAIALVALGLAGIPMRVVGSSLGFSFEWEINHARNVVPESQPTPNSRNEVLIAVSAPSE
jgi:hypothetical protein